VSVAAKTNTWEEASLVNPTSLGGVFVSAVVHSLSMLHTVTILAQDKKVRCCWLGLGVNTFVHYVSVYVSAYLYVSVYVYS